MTHLNKQDASKETLENISQTLFLLYGLCEKKIDQFLSKYKLKLTHLNILLFLSNGRGENFSIADISAHMMLPAEKATGVLDVLIKEKLALKSQNNYNQDAHFSISEKGVAFIEDIWPEYDYFIKNLIVLIPNEKQSAFAQTLSLWAKTLIRI
ncbi:MAG: hypothetical protein LBU87_02825 [Lactobacillales bacterium]|jgi:DNA-binding MarR family transcriptional regulator|nr:hypothetical protein [Lactobacillales bacterium]